ncbi:MAG: family 43 glycosylhydrolase [Chitinispirillaceae bacterium]|nr:family 43 glycosylhydrolase [Chitinispirillaceae bacterium]
MGPTIKSLRAYLYAPLLCCAFSLNAAWDTPDNGNPLLPGYTADPSILYDSVSGSFYIYSTSDGVWISYSADPQVAYSSDFVNWKFRPLTLPSFWPATRLWAPTAVRHPTNGKYYLMYCIGSAAYIAYASTPFGPWTNAVSGNNPLYSSGQLTGSSDWIDPQFFVDADTVYFTFGQSSNMGIARLAFDPETFLATIDDTDPRMSDGVNYRCKRLSGLSNNLEGSCMFRKDGRYFITYSNSACQNYNVRYAVASSPAGPFTYVNRIIVQRDNDDNILGPGHNSILRYGDGWYICYHRQHYQYVDVKRQTCIDRITFNGDNISAGSQTNAGVWTGTGPLESLVASGRAEREPDLAFGKDVIASSESDYKGGTAKNQTETFASIPSFYKARYAVDRNNGTRWAPASLPGFLIVDLAADYRIERCETTFELVMRTYRYRIEYLASGEAAGITAAQNSTAWHRYADRSANKQNVSPVVDSATITARYMKITVLSADLPTSNNELSTILQTDYADRVSVFEFKVFGSEGAVARYTPGLRPGDNRHDGQYVSMDLFSLTGRLLRNFSRQNCRGVTAGNISSSGIGLPAGIFMVRMKTAAEAAVFPCYGLSAKQ